MRGDLVTASHVMRVSSNGQVSIPAETRSRWQTDRVIVVDMGDRIVMRPLPHDAVGPLVGKYSTSGPSGDDARRTARKESLRAESRKNR